MIRITSYTLDNQIVLSDNRPFLLIIENPTEYLRTVQSLYNDFLGPNEGYLFWDDDKEISPAKQGEMLVNPFSFEVIDKKIITLLYKKLQQNYLDGSFLLGLNKINSEISSFLSELTQTVDFSIDYEEIAIEDLLKVCAVKPAKEYQDYLEKIICYINIFTELKSISFFIFVGLKQVLTDKQLEQLYRHCRLQKVSLLLLESSKLRPLLPDEKAIIITEDLCEIVENFENA